MPAVRLEPADVARVALITLLAPACPELAGETLVDAARAHAAACSDAPGPDREEREGDAGILAECLWKVSASQGAAEACEVGQVEGLPETAVPLLREAVARGAMISAGLQLLDTIVGFGGPLVGAARFRAWQRGGS